ncbi:hypothetical protein M501DRAFT_1000161 [Patellaria atrata CBS 101060]|uniref:Uncharacterized protein n=1 Tax=Patellaria atrata CBS 101060 TaxID=1346257 RepID=A0A9P4S3D4_9PEZI|nr:hypothetical protein M501DRAFT_1000161 [Patellaria atrata CBS 101060]
MTFIPLLLASSSASPIFITSGISSPTEMRDGSFPLRKGIAMYPVAGWPKTRQPPTLMYRTNKAEMNMMALDWTRILKEGGAKLFVVSPVCLATSLGGSLEM